MALRELTRDAVLQAVSDSEALGQGRFLQKYGDQPARSFRIRVGERLNHAKAICVIRAIALALVALAACRPGTGSGTTVSYLVTPDGVVSRIRSVAPVVNVEGKRLGVQVAFLGDSPVVERIVRDADRIARALGPEMQLAGETAMMIRAEVGYDPRAIYSAYPSYTVVFSREGEQWLRHEPKNKDEAPLKVEGPLPSPDDPSFPFDPEKIAEAARAASSWMATLDSGDSAAAAAAMTDAYRAEMRSANAAWRDKLARRNALGVVGDRKEVYRLLTRTLGPRLAPDGAVVVLYEVAASNGGRYLERVILVQERGQWRPAGYEFARIGST